MNRSERRRTILNKKKGKTQRRQAGKHSSAIRSIETKRRLLEMSLNACLDETETR